MNQKEIDFYTDNEIAHFTLSNQFYLGSNYQTDGLMEKETRKISPQNANEILSSVEQNQGRFSKDIEGSTVGPILILWGLLAFVGYIGTHFFLKYSPILWIVIGLVGYPVNTYLVAVQNKNKVRFKNKKSITRHRIVLLIWISVYVFGFISVFVLSSDNTFPSPSRIMTYTALLVIFAWFVIGLTQWDKISMLFCVLITALVLTGYFFFPNIISLWLAITLALPIFLFGLFSNFRWRRKWLS